MKKSLRFCDLLTFAAALLTVSVFADTLIRRNPPLHRGGFLLIIFQLSKYVLG